MASDELPIVLSASTLSGNKVRNLAGENLGKIEEFMIDIVTGRIVYAVLSFGGILGLGDKLFAIPWQAMELDTESHSFILDVDRERLENAHGFDKKDWPDMADPRWGEQIYSYWDVTPYW